MKLLSINQDSKTIKGLEKGYLTGIMYLAPYTIGGKNICPFAKAAGCIDACLNTAGRGIFKEIGSIYAHDIDRAFIGGEWLPVIHTKKQKDLNTLINAIL